MEGCIAPSEIPGITSSEASTFGAIAEELIYVDFCQQYPLIGTQVFRDANNPAAYLFFLAVNNPTFSERMQHDFYLRLRGDGLFRIPDFLVHTPAEKSYYEVKPDSPTGITAGVEKVGKLKAIYTYYRLPYEPGARFAPRDHLVANFGVVLRVYFRVRYAGPGLLVYRLCLESERGIELATLAVILAYIVRQMNRQRGTGGFRPIDLEPALRQNQQLADLARTLGITLVVTGAAAVGWRYFWKAVIKRFAVRAAAAATLTAADGPLPVGDLLAAGLAIWTIIDIVRLSDELWGDAAVIARNEA